MSTWSADEVASNVHVTSHRNPELRAASCACLLGGRGCEQGVLIGRTRWMDVKLL